MDFEVITEQAGLQGDDRALVVAHEGWLLACVADGAGGSGGGTMAADLVVSACSRFMGPKPPGERELLRLLRRLDSELAPSGGETTAVLAVVTQYLIYGASVGDSDAFFCTENCFERLTAKQRRKPLVGSGSAIPSPFGAIVVPGARLLLGTDGLFNYVRETQIRAELMGNAPNAASALVNAARLPNGRLQDDAACILVNLRS